MTAIKELSPQEIGDIGLDVAKRHSESETEVSDTPGADVLRVVASVLVIHDAMGVDPWGGGHGLEVARRLLEIATHLDHDSVSDS